MSVFDRLRQLFTPAAAGADRRAYPLQVRCRRCGEIIAVRIDLMNDLSPDYDAGGYIVHKVVVGSGQNRCFQRIEIDLTFDAQKRLLSQEARGGEIVNSA